MKTFLCHFGETENVAGATCAKNLALLKGETEQALESYKIHGGGRNGRGRGADYCCRPRLMLLLEVLQ